MKMKLAIFFFKPLIWVAKGIFKLLGKAASFVKGAFVETERAIAFALILASLALGMWLAMSSGGLNVWRFILPLKAIGVFVAGFGCLYGGMLSEKFHAKAIELSAAEAAKKAADTEQKRKEDMEKAIQERDDALHAKDDVEHELENLKKEHEKVAAELRERKGCGLDVGFVRDIAELNLAEVQMTIDKFHGDDWEAPSDSRAKRNTGFSPDPAKRYIGVLRRSCLVKYGIDMRNLKVLDTPNEVLVFGLAAKVTGTQNVKDDWKLAQVQEYAVKRISPEEAKSLTPDHKTWVVDDRYYAIDEKMKDFKGSRSLDKYALQDKKDEWIRQLTEEIDAGCNMKGINSYVVDMARRLIILLLRPLRKPIRFEDRPIADIEAELGNLGMGKELLSLEDFARGFNRKLLTGSK